MNNHTTELREQTYQLAKWIVEFEFQNPYNKHMSIQELIPLYQAKIESLISDRERLAREKATQQGHWIIRKGGLGNLSYGLCSCGYKTKGYEAEESLESHIDWFKQLQKKETL